MIDVTFAWSAATDWATLPQTSVEATTVGLSGLPAGFSAPQALIAAPRTTADRVMAAAFMRRSSLPAYWSLVQMKTVSNNYTDPLLCRQSNGTSTRNIGRH